MPSFVAVVATAPDGRIAKYAEFATRPAADAHAVQFGGFVVAKPAAPWSEWQLNAAGNALIVVPLPPRPPIPDTPTVAAIKRIATATGVDISDLSI